MKSAQKQPPSPSALPPASFEAALQELETLVQSLENGGISLEDSLHAYERGVSLLKHCQATLGEAEQKIRILDGDKLRDFDPDAAPGNTGT